jgi:hypothetical protein
MRREAIYQLTDRPFLFYRSSKKGSSLVSAHPHGVRTTEMDPTSEIRTSWKLIATNGMQYPNPKIPPARILKSVGFRAEK